VSDCTHEVLIFCYSKCWFNTSKHYKVQSLATHISFKVLNVLHVTLKFLEWVYSVKARKLGPTGEMVPGLQVDPGVDLIMGKDKTRFEWKSKLVLDTEQSTSYFGTQNSYQ
jgi:hypothetical protein